MIWKIKRWISHIYHRIKTGVSYKDTWSLDYYINHITYEWLIKFKEFNNWHPYGITEEKWDRIIDEMIDWYWLLCECKEYIINEESMKWIEYMFYTKEEEKKIKKAKRLFNKWERWLWW